MYASQFYEHDDFTHRGLFCALPITVFGFTYYLIPDIVDKDGKECNVCYIDRTIGFLIDMIDTRPTFRTDNQAIKHLEKELKAAKEELLKRMESIK